MDIVAGVDGALLSIDTHVPLGCPRVVQKATRLSRPNKYSAAAALNLEKLVLTTADVTFY